MALLQEADAKFDSAGETQPTATKAVRRTKNAIATLWRPPMEANRAG